MQPISHQFLDNAGVALRDDKAARQRDIMARRTPPLRAAAVEEFGEFDALREHVGKVRKHTLQHLDRYLEQYEREAVRNGCRVHFARDGGELNDLVLDICQQHGAHRVGKGKSMVTEETGLTEYLEAAGLRVTETDLGEYIIQQAGEKPSHIVRPAVHKTAAQIGELFQDKHPLGERDLTTPGAIVQEARQVLRQHFLEAEVGIIGANALVAENGYSMLVTNEGNGDLCANLPPVLIVCTTLDRVLPTASDAAAMLRLLVRSSTGQPQTCYTSFYSGPRRSDDLDGPIEAHVVLLDNGRCELLDSRYDSMLECIRCGACLNHCPVYQSVGGHAYGWVYQGPMGSVMTPLLTSLEEGSVLASACTACGRCAEVCPADIPIPDLLRDLRQDEAEAGLNLPRWRYGLRLHSWLAGNPTLYRLATSAASRAVAWLGRGRGRVRALPMARGWSAERDFPVPQGDTFMRQYRRKKR
ncbi:MAG: lactate utilization protein B [Pseudomonadota bacterium]